MKRKRLFYLHPRNPHTNKVISEALEESEMMRRRSEGSNELIELWECPQSKMSFFLEAKRMSPEIAFYVYTCIQGEVLVRVASKRMIWKITREDKDKRDLSMFAAKLADDAMDSNKCLAKTTMRAYVLSRSARHDNGAD